MLTKFGLVILLNFLILFTIQAQGCSVDQILSQETIDNFATDHPGCKTVLGTLNITGLAESMITNLEGLSQLEEVTGTIDISGSVPTLQGLHNIKRAGALILQTNNTQSLEGLEGLEEIGDILLNGLEISSLDGLSNLHSIGQDLSIQNCDKLTSVSGLSSLTEIGRSFKIYGSPRLQNLYGLPNATIGQDIAFTWCDSLSTLEGLEQFNGEIRSFTVTSNKNLRSLTGIENIIIQRGLTISGNDRLQSLAELNLNDTLLGDLIISANDSLTSLHGLEELVYIDDLEIKRNELLTNLEGLNSVKLIDVFLVDDNDILEDFSGLDSLSIVGLLTLEDNPQIKSFKGLERLDTIYRLVVDDNEELKNFEGLSSLKSIKFGASIKSNDKLQTLDGLDSLSFIMYIGLTGNDALKNLNGFRNVTQVDGPIYIQFHDSLTDISGLANIDPTNISAVGSIYSSFDISIRKNPMLEECAIETVCGKFTFPGATVRIEENAVGCQSVEEVMEQCDNLTGLIGHLYEDINSNGIYDEDDKPIANGKVSISIDNNTEAIDYTDNDGKYRIFTPPGTYPLTYGYDTHCFTPMEVDTTVIIIDSLVTEVDYSLERMDSPPIEAIDDYKIYLSRAATRCGFTVKHHVAIVNNSCLDSYASINYKLDDKIDSVFNISIPDVVENQGVISYDIPELLTPGARFEFTFEAIMPGVDAIDSIILDSVMVEYIYPGLFDFNGSITEVFTSPITCAYDPNDKLVHPDRSNIYDEAFILNEELTYTIRFQNTGSDTAFTVQLEDQISSLLNLSTLRPVQASHNYQYTVGLDSRLLTVTFDDILLPDSTTNQLGSNGFFTFSIMPNANLEENTVIENFADIFFDFNPPIRTNTMEVVYVSNLPIPSSVLLIDRHSYTVFPNPTHGQISVAGLNHFYFEIYNLRGQMVSSGSSSGKIDLLDLAPSVYFLILKTKNGNILGREKIVNR